MKLTKEEFDLLKHVFGLALSEYRTKIRLEHDFYRKRNDYSYEEMIEFDKKHKKTDNEKRWLKQIEKIKNLLSKIGEQINA